MPRNQLEALQRVLRAARLKPVIFALGVTALQAAGAEPGRVVLLAVRNNAVDLQVTGGGGIVALRSLDGAIETEGAQKSISADLVAREIRITLGQLPGGLAETPGKLKIFGQGELAKQLVQRPLAPPRRAGAENGGDGKVLCRAVRHAVAAGNRRFHALALAANYVRGVDVEPDFLPPKVQPWRQLVSHAPFPAQAGLGRRGRRRIAFVRGRGFRLPAVADLRFAVEVGRHGADGQRAERGSGSN